MATTWRFESLADAAKNWRISNNRWATPSGDGGDGQVEPGFDVHRHMSGLGHVQGPPRAGKGGKTRQGVGTWANEKTAAGV